MQKGFNRLTNPIGRLLLVLVATSGAISLVRTTAAQGHDFLVFWNGAHNVLSGLPLYSILRDGGSVFKYPPWIIPFFFPFTLLSPDTAKWVWGLLEIASLIAIVRWLISDLEIPWKTWCPLLICYWGLWIVHAFDGQIALPMLALALHLVSAELHFTYRFSFRLFFLVCALSTKIFTGIPLLSLKWNRKSISAILWITLILSVLSLPALWNETHHSPLSLLHSWSEAATSGGKLLDASQLRGRLNPGFPGFALRLLHIPASQSNADLIATVLFAASIGSAWAWMSRRLPHKIRWVGWLAITPMVHPLPWWHLFVFTFPLANVTLMKSVLNRNIPARILCVLGIFLICLSTEKLFGSFGVFLELNAAKSWGTLCCLISCFLMH